MGELLTQKLLYGVKIRIVTMLCGMLPYQYKLNIDTLNELQSNGAEVRLYPGLETVRYFNYAKLVIIDNKAACVGSRNLGETFGYDNDWDT